MLAAETSGWVTRTPWGIAIGLSAMLVLSGWLIAWIGHRSRSGRLEMNPWMGIRTPTTMSSDRAWKAAHAAGGRWLMAAGIVPALIGAVLPLRPSENVTVALTLFALTTTCILVIVAGVLGTKAAKLTTESPEDP